ITAGTTPVLKEGRNLALTAVPAGFPAGAEIQYSWTVESATAGAPAPAEIYGSASSVNVSVKSKPDASGSAIVKVSATCGTLTASATQTVSVVPFVVTVSGGTGDGATAHAGTEADPYILKYNGTDNTDETKITVTVSGNSGSIVARSNVTGLTIGHPASGDTTQHITISKTALAATAIPAAGKTFKITVRDYEAGTAGAADNDDCLYAKRTFWVKIPQPDFTVSFNTGTGGSSAPADQTVTCGSYATAPANPTNTDTTLVFGGWYAGTAGAGGTVTLASTAFNFTTTAVTEDLTLYAKWLHTNFTGTAAEFLAADFVPNNNATTAYTITITSATNDELAEIALALGKSTSSNYKGGVYVNLDLSGCGVTEIPNDAFNASSSNIPNLKQYLTGITLPNTLIKIGHCALSECTALSGTLTIPASVEYLGYLCFEGTSLSGLSYENTTSIWKKYDWNDNLMSNVNPTTCPALDKLGSYSSGRTSWRRQ
ncbi:MAG: leucine-rich repeat protein, partial [Treponema sp.]|nr:leucine-rich repeat protein [Treponema sp.]